MFILFSSFLASDTYLTIFAKSLLSVVLRNICAAPRDEAVILIVFHTFATAVREGLSWTTSRCTDSLRD
jgi:hypothetical protein